MTDVGLPSCAPMLSENFLWPKKKKNNAFHGSGLMEETVLLTEMSTGCYW